MQSVADFLSIKSAECAAFSLGNSACRSLLISKALSYLIIAGSFTIKLPQIFKIRAAGNADGVSLTMFLLETIIFSLGSALGIRGGYALSTYVESVIIGVQVVVLTSMIASHQLGGAAVLLYLAGTGAFLAFLLSRSAEFLSSLITVNIAFAIASRLPQIVSNWRQGHTGQLAFLSFFLNFAGAVARVFTTLTEVDNKLILYAYIISSVLNGILVIQILVLGGVNDQKKKRKKKLKKK